MRDFWTERFNTIWAIAAQEGRCDPEGSADNRRVLRMWFEAGRPVNVLAFIDAHALLPPEHPSFLKNGKED